MAAPAAIPEFIADAHWQSIDLLSDVHLQPGLPETFDRWRRHLLETPAEAVLILGDLFELWVGDDARHEGFEAACAQVLQQASRHRTVAFMPGNRDFLVGPELLAACGVLPLADPTVLVAFGQRLLLTHGDALCLSDPAYLRFRQQVRDPVWQHGFLAQPLAQRQAQARAMRQASAEHQAGQDPEISGDVDDSEAVDWLVVANATTMVHGHTHRPGSHALPLGRRRHVLGDWHLEASPPRARALRLTAQGLAVLDLATA